MGGMSIWHWVVVALIVMLLFGRGKVSELMGDFAKGIKAFKKGMADEDEAPKAPQPAPPVTAAEPVRTLPPQPTHEPVSAAVAQPTPASTDRKAV